MDPAMTTASTAAGSRFVILEDGCFRDTSVLVRDDQGNWCYREYTPTLNPDGPLPHAECQELVISSSLAGGGWQVASTEELNQLVDRTRENPALPAHPSLEGVKANWHWTRDSHVKWCADSAWYVSLHNGHVNASYRDSCGYVLGCRLTGREISQEPVKKSYSADYDGDWFESPSDAGLMSYVDPAAGAVVELVVGAEVWTEKFRVTQVPDENGIGEYEVEELTPRNIYAALDDTRVE